MTIFYANAVGANPGTWANTANALGAEDGVCAQKGDAIAIGNYDCYLTFDFVAVPDGAIIQAISMNHKGVSNLPLFWGETSFYGRIGANTYQNAPAPVVGLAPCARSAYILETNCNAWIGATGAQLKAGTWWIRLAVTAVGIVGRVDAVRLTITFKTVATGTSSISFIVEVVMLIALERHIKQRKKRRTVASAI